MPLKSANEVQEQTGSIHNDPRSGDLAHSHQTLAARVDDIVAKLKRNHGINIDNSPTSTGPDGQAVDASANQQGQANQQGPVNVGSFSNEELWAEINARKADGRIKE
jgi:hypothetical protein